MEEKEYFENENREDTTIDPLELVCPQIAINRVMSYFDPDEVDGTIFEDLADVKVVVNKDESFSFLGFCNEELYNFGKNVFDPMVPEIAEAGFFTDLYWETIRCFSIFYGLRFMIPNLLETLFPDEKEKTFMEERYHWLRVVFDSLNEEGYSPDSLRPMNPNIKEEILTGKFIGTDDYNNRTMSVPFSIFVTAVAIRKLHATTAVRAFKSDKTRNFYYIKFLKLLTEKANKIIDSIRSIEISNIDVDPGVWINMYRSLTFHLSAFNASYMNAYVTGKESEEKYSEIMNAIGYNDIITDAFKKFTTEFLMLPDTVSDLEYINEVDDDNVNELGIDPDLSEEHRYPGYKYMHVLLNGTQAWIDVLNKTSGILIANTHLDSMNVKGDAENE